MRLRRPRTDKRTWSRRLADEEAREFVERELEETREVYRTASGEFQLDGLCRDAFAAGSTTDLRWLKSRGFDAQGFYRTELAPSWEGLDQRARAQKLERFIELSNMMGAADLGGQPSEQVRDMVAAVHIKVLLLAWAYDRTYGFIDRIFNGPLQYRHHRVRLAPAARSARRARAAASPARAGSL
ncbi:MAG: hypothetical protein QOK25_871 [Thermoleophilaceae bacterium]|jgi:hypothetical protein|nr:hypothetical protein [Thermoleophilaceae bacterium]